MVGNKPISRIGIGPMSPEIIEAVFRYSAGIGTPLMLISSKNQIDWDRGYVENWNTDEYAKYIATMKKKYPKALVYICRDHCGPGFKNDNLDDVYKTIDADIKNNFDLIHVDFCHYSKNKSAILTQSKRTIDYILKKKPGILIEVGTDENRGDMLSKVEDIEALMRFFVNIAPVHFFVVQSGSLVKEVNQVGSFNQNFLKKVKKVSEKYSMFLKEHNADYLPKNEIKKRQGVVDAINIAPQYGVIQTQVLVSEAFKHGISPFAFLERAYDTNKWKKWLHTNDESNKMLCAMIAGHYAFTTPEYRYLYEKVNAHIDTRELIINEIMKNIRLYDINLNHHDLQSPHHSLRSRPAFRRSNQVHKQGARSRR